MVECEKPTSCRLSAFLFTQNRGMFQMTNGIVPQLEEVSQHFVSEKFGRWTTSSVTFLAPKNNKTKTLVLWIECKCVCGVERDVRYADLRKGKSISCGCQRATSLKRHGSPKTSEYYAYRNMKSRCRNKNSKDYPDYGGRGVFIFPEWLAPNGQGYLNWFAHIGPKPHPSMSQDRYPNPDGNYEPGNVRWATLEQQASNKRTTVWITHQGRTQTMTQWNTELGFKRGTIHNRLKAGKTIEEAMQPIRKS